METPNTFPKFSNAKSLESYLVENALKNYASLFGQPNYWWGPVLLDGGMGGGPIALPGSPITPSPAPGRPNTTNTQVFGVDEADLIETDGEYLYQVNGSTLTIVDTRDRANLKITSQLALPTPWNLDPSENQSQLTFPVGGPSGGWTNIDGIYLQGDRLTVISTGNAPQPVANSAWLYPGYNPGQSQVQVTVLDVADPSHVRILEVSVLEGSLVTSRAIGDEVVVLTNNAFQLPAPLVIPNNSDRAPTPIATPAAALPILPPYPPQPTGTYETREAYLKRIENQVLDLGLPNVVTRNADGQVVTSGLLTQPTEIYQSLASNPVPQLFNVSTFNTVDQHLGVDRVAGIPTDWGNNVFVSADYLYLLQSVYDSLDYKTKILQIDLDTNQLVAAGEVPGLIDSRFSADEYGGFFRISTTTGFGNASRNNVYVLDQVAQKLEIVGKLEGLAPGERIFSTRFQGDYGFVVTFRQVDPLFTIDLRDPKNPKVAGELKIPGFSEYLQVIEQNGRKLLLGVGRDADPVTGRQGELKISLFDVTDPTKPIEIDSYRFTGFGTSSDALWDNRAITYVPEQKLLAIPTQQYQNLGVDAKLTVFNIDAVKGIDRIGEVSHGSDWINRSVSIRNDLYAVSGQRVSVYGLPGLNQLDDLSWKIASNVPLQPLQWSSSTIANETEAAQDLFGDRFNDVLNGGGGNDRIYGNGGSDRLLGGAGNDEIYGASSAEWFDGGLGDDTFYLNSGEDIVVLRRNDGSDTVNGFEVGKTKFSLANGLTFSDLIIRQAEGFASVSVGSQQLARVNWVDASRLNQASNFIST
jgi:hypothetical protein